MQNPTIGIIGGKGRMGGLFASFFKEHDIKVLISDKGTRLTNIDLAKKVDITIISVPIDLTEKVIKEVLPHVPKTSAIMDLTSVKEIPVKGMLKGKCEVLGIHPMFADSNPIQGQAIILTPTRKSGPHSSWMEKFLKVNGTKIYKMSPKQHDKLMSAAQGMIHFADIAFADTVRRLKVPIKDLLKYTSKPSELKIQLAARLVHQSPTLYGNIQIQNPHNLKAIKSYKKSVDQLYKIVKKKNLKSFTDYFLKGRKFLGNYTKQAFDDSTYLVDKFLEKSAQPSSHRTKPKFGDLALLGPANTFSDLAAASINQPKYYAKDIDEVFELVEKGRVASGLVPIENKLHGTIRETLDALFYKKVHITNEIDLPIHHCMIILKTAKKSDIKTVISHSQALNQCKKYLKKNFSKSEIQSASSTGAALEKLTNKSIAVIAPAQAANSHHTIHAKNIEDHSGNSTLFLLIKKFPTTLNSHNKTSIAFYFSKDSSGSLSTVFKQFKDAKVNMTKIESRPTKAQFGQYIFFLDFEGHTYQPKVKKLLDHISSNVAKLKVLGSY